MKINKNSIYLIFKNEVNAEVMGELNKDTFFLSLKVQESSLNNGVYNAIIEKSKSVFEFSMKNKELYLKKGNGIFVLLGSFDLLSKEKSTLTFNRVANFWLIFFREVLA